MKFLRHKCNSIALTLVLCLSHIQSCAWVDIIGYHLEQQPDYGRITYVEQEKGERFFSHQNWLFLLIFSYGWLSLFLFLILILFQTYSKSLHLSLILFPANLININCHLLRLYGHCILLRQNS